MFVWSIKTSKRELLVLLIGIIAFIAALVYVLWPTGGTAQTSALVEQGYSIKGDSNEDRIQFLKQFGWEVKTQQKETREIAIPLDFSDVYTKYNEMQKQQGFDLEAYKGKRVQRFTYEITNYPGEKQDIIANLLVINGEIIGGDISSPALEGFMHGFSLDTMKSTTVSVTSEDLLSQPTLGEAVSETVDEAGEQASDAAAEQAVGESAQTSADND